MSPPIVSFTLQTLVKTYIFRIKKRKERKKEIFVSCYKIKSTIVKRWKGESSRTKYDIDTCSTRLSLKISRRTSRRGCTREFPHQVHCSRLNITRRLTKLLLVGHLLSGWPTLRPIFPRKSDSTNSNATTRFNRN